MTNKKINLYLEIKKVSLFVNNNYSNINGTDSSSIQFYIYSDIDYKK